jgi:predicted nucleic acid-binding protein
MEQKIIIADTNVVIDYLNGNQSVIEFFIKEHHLIFISCITKAEVQQGATNKTHLNKLNKVLDLFPIIEIDINTSQNFNSLFEKFVLSNQCTIPDMLIAATALRYDIELFTFNIKDFAT